MAGEEQPDVQILERDGFVEARYLGAYSFESYKKQMEVSVRACLERKHTLLLVDITSLSGFQPTTMERHQIGVYGASLSRELSRVAALGTGDQIEPQPLATTVARNRGLRVQAFVDRARAVEWLLSEDP